MKARPVILIVDDQPENIALLEMYLAGQGYEIVTATCGEEALGKLSGNQIDLILLDVLMPGMDGFEVTRRVRQDDAHRLLPIILITALQEKEDRIKGIEAGCDDFISRPVDKIELLARIRSLLKVKAYNDLLSNYQKELEDEVTGRTEKLKQALEILQQDITERKRLELELSRANENNFVNIIDSAADGILIADIESKKFLSGNPAICLMLGYSQEEIKNLGVTDIHSEKDIPYIIDHFEKLAKGEITLSRDLPVKRKDGAVIYADVNTTTITLAGKKYLLGFFHDNAERKQAEAQREAVLESLRQSEEKYRTILENMQESYYELDLAGNFTFVNNTVCRHMGYSKDELIGMNYRQYTDKEDLQRVFQAYSKVYLTGEPFEEFCWQIIKKDGTKMYIEGSASLKKDSGGKPIGFKGIDHDITDRKKAEEELRQSEEKYRTILENIQEGYFEVDLAGNFTFFNDSICRILDYSKAELRGMNNRQYSDKETSKEVFQAFNKVYKTGEPIKEVNWQAIRKDGTKRYVEASASLQKDSAGKPIGFRGIIRDITERRQVENAIKESEEKFRSIVLWSVDAIIVTDAKGKIKFMNPVAGRFFNREAEGFLGTDFGLPLVNGKSTEIDIVCPGKDPGVGDMYVIETEWLGEKAHLITIRDITEHKKTEEKIIEAQKALLIINNKLEERNRQNSLLSEMRELLQSCSNVQEVPAIVISYATQLFPGTDGALFMLSDPRTDLQSVASWGNFPEDVDNNIFAPDACWGLRKGRVYAVEDMKTGPICPHLKQSSSTTYICLPLIGKGELLGLLHLGTKRSVQGNDRQANFFELKEIAVIFAEYLSLSIANIKLSEKLVSQSILDPLTRLYNRRYMDEIIQHEILRAARKQTGIGVVMIDIDHFKKINDTYGHETGDEYLMKLADFFKLKIRGSDFIFRYGGEEFMLVLPESSVEDTYKYAESLRIEIKNMKIHFRGQLLPLITLSFGIAAYPDHGLETIELIRVADKALYRAKEEGRDRVIIG